MLIVVVGPSGAGKTSVINLLLRRRPEIKRVRVLSTRQPRYHEADRLNVEPEEFEERRRLGHLKWVTTIFDTYYGPLAADIDKATARPRPIYILDLAFSEIHQVQALRGHVEAALVLPPSEDDLRNRLHLAGRDDRIEPSIIQYRECITAVEVGLGAPFRDRPPIINSDLDQACRQLEEVVNSVENENMDNLDSGWRPSVAEIRKLAQQARATHLPAFARPYRSSPDAETNEFLLFLKPDILELGDSLEPVWDLILGYLDKFGVELIAGAALDSELIKSRRLIEEHYGVINSVSVNGIKALSQGASSNLDALIADLDPRPEVLGAHQFIDRYPMFTPEALSILYDNLESYRFAGGTHGVLVKVKGRPSVLLNGFHPEQIALFESTGAAIMCFAARSTSTWRQLRHDMTGATDPNKAAEGSIRKSLLENQRELGLGPVTPLRNGIHVSAGPLEAVAEIVRYLTPYGTSVEIEAKETTFGKGLVAASDVTTLMNLLANPPVEIDSLEDTAFDATEERDAAEVLELIRSKRLRLKS